MPAPHKKTQSKMIVIFVLQFMNGSNYLMPVTPKRVPSDAGK